MVVVAWDARQSMTKLIDTVYYFYLYTFKDERGEFMGEKQACAC